MDRQTVRSTLVVALVLVATLPQQIHGFSRRMLESQEVDLPGKAEEALVPESEASSVSVIVRLAEAPTDGIQPVEGIEIGAWIYDPWANLMPERIGGKVLLYSPELFSQEGMLAEVPLGAIPEHFKPSQEKGHLLYFLKIEDMHDCCRYAYTMDYISFVPDHNPVLLLTPELAPDVCNSQILCQPEGAYSVSLSLQLDAEPEGGFQQQEGLNVSIYAYNLTKWPEGGVQPSLVTTKTLQGSQALPIAEPLVIDFAFMLPGELAKATLDEVAVYAAVLSLNSSRYNYFGFQPLHKFADEPVVLEAKLTPPSPEVSAMAASGLTLDDLPAGLFPEINTPEVILPEITKPPPYSPPELTVPVNVTVDKAPFDGFMKDEGIVATVFAFFDTDASHDEAEPVGSTVITDVDGLLGAGAIAEVTLDLSVLELASAEELAGLEFYVTLGSIGDCCRYSYHEDVYTQVFATSSPSPVMAVLDTNSCSAEICTEAAAGGVSVNAVFPSLTVVRATLEVDGAPPGGFGPGEGVLVSIWAQISKEDPLLANFAGDPIEISQLLVIPSNDTDTMEVLMPLDFAMASEGLLRALTEQTAKMWATVSTPKCCRYDAYYHFGLENIDPRAAVPEVALKADIDDEACDAEVLCTIP